MGEPFSVKLGDVADIVMGQSPSGDTCNRNGIGDPLLNGPTEFGPHHPVATQFTTDAKKYSKHQDVLFCVRGSTTGRMNWSDKEYAIGRGIAAIRHKRHTGFHPLIRYTIEYHLPTLLQVATGSTFPNVSAHQLAEIPFTSVSEGEQLAIASLFGVLDDKIELNRQTNETFEAMARTLFKDWFVDFGPTRAKIEGCASYLALDLWSLFPDRLDVETGLPEGWEMFRLRDLADHHKRTLQPSEFPGVIYEHFSMPAFSKGQTPALDFGETIKSNKTIIPEMSILLCKLNPEISRVWLPEPPSDYQQVSSTEFLALTATEPAGRSLLYCLLRDDRFRDLLQSMITGTTHQRVSPPSLLEREVLCGKADIFHHFENIADSLLGPTLANRAEARTLAQTRDFLLPKLMSGEIRLREAEQIVGEAL